MAAGDILSATVLANGWTMDVVVEGVGAGGTYSFGMGANNAPAAAKVVLALTSQGYSVAGTLGTKARTVYGVPCAQPNIGAMRRADPNDALPTETGGGGNVTIRIALSDYVFIDDTAVTVSIAAGWYTAGAVPSNLHNSLAVTNNSALVYPRVVGNWAWPCFDTVHTDFLVEFVAFHGYAEGGKPLALVRISATDEHSHTVTYDVTDMTISARTDPYGKVLVYAATIATSTLTDGDIITVRSIAYPWVGDAASLLDTGDGTNAVGSPLYTNQQYRLDKADDHGKCVVDLVSGNDSTGAVYATQGLAEAGSAYLTIGAALTALAAYHNTHSGHNDAGGGHIYLSQGNHILNSANGGTLSQWVTIEPKTTALKASTFVSPAADGSAIPTFCHLKSISNVAAYYWGCGNKHLWIDNCSMQAGHLVIAYQILYSAVTMSDVTFAGEFGEFSTANECWAIVRGTTTPTKHNGPLYVVLGCRNIYLMHNEATGNPVNDGFIYAYNEIDTTSAVSVIQYSGHNIVHGCAIAQNVIVRRADETIHLFGIGDDASVNTSRNVLIFNNTIQGSRANIAYNDAVSGGPYLHTLWFIRNNILMPNTKDDTFGNNASATGGWSVGYHVGCRYNLFYRTSGDEWRGEFFGLDTIAASVAVPIDPLYVNDQSAYGGGLGGGDYHLQAGSPAVALAGDNVLPYDFVGTVRRTGGAIGAYEVVPTVAGRIARFRKAA